MSNYSQNEFTKDLLEVLQKHNKVLVATKWGIAVQEQLSTADIYLKSPSTGIDHPYIFLVQVEGNFKKFREKRKVL